MLEELRRRINKDHFNAENIEFYKAMKDTYGKRTYTCKCGRLTEDYVWQSELAKHKVNCFQCGKELTIDNLKAASAVQVASIRTPTKNR